MIRYALGLLAALFFALPATAQGSYQIQPGDVLQVEVLDDPSLNRTVLVLPGGDVTFPLAGTVQAGGRTVDQFQNALTQQLAPNFAAEPTVFVSIASLAQEQAETPMVDAIQIYAMGELANPGQFNVEPGTTLLQFLAASGGFTRFAATKRIQLRRRDPRTGREALYTFNYDAVERGAVIPQEIVLAEGDIVVVPERRLFE